MKEKNSCKNNSCFYNGELALYCKSEDRYELQEINFEKLLSQVEGIICEKWDKRPKMQDVWRIVCAIVNPNYKYYPNYTIKKELNDNSFEKRFTSNILPFIDNIYPRVEDDYVKQARMAYEEWVKTTYWEYQKNIHKSVRVKTINDWKDY